MKSTDDGKGQKNLTFFSGGIIKIFIFILYERVDKCWRKYEN